MASHWQKITPQERSRRAENVKKYWESLTEDERQEIFKISATSRTEASKNGSKFEKILNSALTKAGFRTIIHKKGAIINPDLEIDIVVSDIKTVIEVDGPTHHFPIFGDERLAKQQRADDEKNGLLLESGYVVIRLKHVVNNLTEKYKRDTIQLVVDKLNEIKNKFPEEKDRLIYLG